MGTINEHEDPLATWELTPDDDPVLVSHKDTNQPLFCVFLNNPESDSMGRPYAYGLRNDGRVSLAQPQVDIYFSGELRVRNLMRLTQDTCFLKAPLRLTDGGSLELGCLDVGPAHFKVLLPSDGNMSLEGGKRIINAPTFVNGTLAIQHQPNLKGTAFDLGPLHNTPILLFMHMTEIFRPTVIC